MKIIPLSEGSFTIDKTKVFVPFDENKDDIRERSTGSLLVEVQPFLIITDNDILLLDAGLGFTNDRNVLQIHQNLMDNGITINRPPRDGQMAFVRSPDLHSIELLQKGDALPPQEPWTSMQNTGHW